MPGRLVETFGPGEEPRWTMEQIHLNYLLLADSLDVLYREEHEQEAAMTADLMNLTNFCIIVKAEQPTRYSSYTFETFERLLEDLKHYHKDYVEKWEESEVAKGDGAKYARQGFRNDFLKAAESTIAVAEKVDQIPDGVFDRICVGFQNGLSKVELAQSLNKIYPAPRGFGPKCLGSFIESDVYLIHQYLQHSNHQRFEVWKGADVESNDAMKTILEELERNV
ncbi:MAG: hypothetical protein Q9216_003652 [Gyalolechia sp. 2 TL-2023]